MYTILPIEHLSQRLYEGTAIFSELSQLPALNIEQCHEVVALIIEHLIFGRLHWTSAALTQTNLYDEIDKLLLLHLSWWVGGRQLAKDRYGRYSDAQVYIHQTFNEQVLDDIVRSAQRVVSQLMCSVEPDDLWRVWHTQRLGSDLVVEKGQDYRIIEFERQVLSGQIKVDPAIFNAIQQGH